MGSSAGKLLTLYRGEPSPKGETFGTPDVREITLAAKCERCGRWFNIPGQRELEGKCPNCGGDFYLFKAASFLDD